MDLNPLFTSHTAFRPGSSGSSGGELELFEQTGIQLVHGWLADPASTEYAALAKTEDYDSSVNLVVDADYLTKGKLVEAQHDYVTDDSRAAGPSNAVAASNSSGGPSSPGGLTEADAQKVKDGENPFHLTCMRYLTPISHRCPQLPGDCVLTAHLLRSLYSRLLHQARLACSAVPQLAPLRALQVYLSRRRGALPARDGRRVPARADDRLGAARGRRGALCELRRRGFSTEQSRGR